MAYTNSFKMCSIVTGDSLKTANELRKSDRMKNERKILKGWFVFAKE